MSRRSDSQPSQPQPAPDQTDGGHGRAAAALVVQAGRVQREVLVAQLSGRGVRCVAVPDAAHARAAMESQTFDVALIARDLHSGQIALADDTDHMDGFELARWASKRDAALSVIVMAEGLAMDDALTAMRAGACDVIETGLRGDQVLRHVMPAIERTKRLRERAGKDAQRTRRLREVCRKLNAARHDLANEVGTLCEDVTLACSELADQLGSVGVAAEFKALISHELDIETLLRTVLEYLLARTGPTNAAIFLPASSGDYSLGAYVNYDRPKDSAEMILDHLADAVPCKLEDEAGTLLITNQREMEERFGDAAHWLDDQHVLTYTCVHDGEALAVVMFFRERTLPFKAEVVKTLETVGPVMSSQLAKVIRVHHRHGPKFKFRANESEDDIGGMAA